MSLKKIDERLISINIMHTVSYLLCFEISIYLTAWGATMIRILLILLTSLFSLDLLAGSGIKGWFLIQSNTKVSYYHRVSGVFKFYAVSRENISLTMIGLPKELCSLTAFSFQGQLIRADGVHVGSKCIHTIISQKGRNFIIDAMENNDFVMWDGSRLTTFGFSDAFDKVGSEVVIL